ncbi:PREDICTED: probable receptor-like protein kinase At1g67000 isoform X2 [Brassica oleracea var. oleracea]|uniref:probable receptor-like protein kinase At1g67000 isoform X2 n=1 Tax=Brassica oleracea var. oleracea TaxID=109376 RepID=UPI0006A74C0E|nr:PREDICTED: probable receptor-like protein kinase At1g67000 isoform X2 [Brassica oleracea var. oleracea]
MYRLPTSCMILFFIFYRFHQILCASSEKEIGRCDALFQCGDVTAGFPFSGRNRPEVCGHPLLRLHCINNITSLIISNQEFYVLKINKTSNTLTLARPDLLGSFCSSTFTKATLPTEIFELSPTYKSVNVFYLCAPFLSYPSSSKCPEIGPISISEKPEYNNTCRESFTVNLPTSFLPEEKELNMTHLESALREGFEVKVNIDENACQECLSSHALCGFDQTFPSGVKCAPLYPPDADDIRRRCSASFSCGDQKDLMYPFWIPGREDCGHPDFKLECNASFAELTIFSVKFRILEMDYSSRVIRLSRSDYISNICPLNPVSAPFDENVIPFSPDTEMLTIYYDCRTELSQSVSTYVGEISCHDDVRSYYVTRNLSSPLLSGVRGLINDFKGICRRNVSIPASRPALDTLERTPTPDNLKKALEEGFDLAFNEDCSLCMVSGGACGYTQISSRFVCYCDGWVHTNICDHLFWGIGVVFWGSVVSLFLVGIFYAMWCTKKTSDDLRQHDLKALIPLKQYSYAQVKIITKSFVERVGKGGFGTVYRGTLCDGRSVAVKILKDSKGNGEDFINEVASISKTSHVNIVDLLGFCVEGSKRAILYEFLENGSLDRFISKNASMSLDWMTLHNISLGIARGLEYLHHGCKARIVHFDIKPHNILLDENLCPKVSDFGLAKLCKKKESILSPLGTRGTIGYIAPEVFSRMYGSVSHKSDVYSYGMLVLEMIGARNKERADQNSASNASSMYFPDWIYKDLEKGENERLKGSGIISEEEEIAKKMTLVGLWCIQSSPSDRPPMNRVVEMMEGNLDALEVPPRPVLQIPPAPLQDSSTLSEDVSASTEV